MSTFSRLLSVDYSPQGQEVSVRSSERGLRGLKRGAACIVCRTFAATRYAPVNDSEHVRRRRMRCDGQRPHCGQCSQTQRPEDCEYSGKQGRTYTEILEEHLRHLKSRIQELECRPQYREAPVRLHDPYKSLGARQFSTPKAIFPPIINAHLAIHSGHPGSRGLPDPRQAEAPSTRSGESDTEEFKADLRNLLQRRHSLTASGASSLHIALYLPKLIRHTDLPEEHDDYPHATLRSAISMWLAGGDGAQLNDAMAALPNALATSASPAHRLQGIQTEVLVARHFLRNARLIEGRYHAAAAAAAVLACGLHRIEPGPRVASGAHECSADALFELGESGYCLPFPPPCDAIELAERINVFWEAYTFDLCWSVALNLPPTIPVDTVITTPLPVSWEACENTPLEDFLQQAKYCSELSIPVAHAVSASLFGSTTSLIWRHTETPGRVTINDEFLRSVAEFDERIRKFASTLRHLSGGLLERQKIGSEEPRFLANDQEISLSAKSDGVQAEQEQHTESNSARRALAFATTIIHGATIQLHYTLSMMHRMEESGDREQALSGCRNKSVAAAREIVRIVQEDLAFADDQAELRELDFFIGVVWQSAARVLIEEAESAQLIMRDSGDNTGSSIKREEGFVEAQKYLREVSDDIHLLQAAMHELGRTCPLMKIQSGMLQLSR